jgi:hypothetical protein
MIRVRRYTLAATASTIRDAKVEAMMMIDICRDVEVTKLVFTPQWRRHHGSDGFGGKMADLGLTRMNVATALEKVFRRL